MVSGRGSTASGGARAQSIVMLLENFTYPQDTRVRNEAESLAGAGHRVCVLAPRGPGQPAREWLNGVLVRRYRMVWAGRSTWSYLAEYGVAHAQLLVRTLIALLRGARTLHVNAPPDTLAIAAIAVRLAGGRVVYDMHDSGPELFEAKFGRSRLVSILRLAQRLALTVANQVIVTNESQAELARSLLGAGRERGVTVVRNGPRAAEFARPSPGRGGVLSEPQLVYVGTLDVQDGVLALPRLMTAPRLSGARLTIVGDGAAEAELRAECERAGVAARVCFTGRVAHERVAELIAAADIAIDPAPANDLNHGSTMIKVAEYLSCARPVVAYELRETRRTAGEAALYAPDGDGDAFVTLIAELAGDGDRRLRLGELARQRALQLGWERSERALLAVYDRLT